MPRNATYRGRFDSNVCSLFETGCHETPRNAGDSIQPHYLFGDFLKVLEVCWAGALWKNVFSVALETFDSLK